MRKTKINMFKICALARRDFPERVRVSILTDICPSLGRTKLRKNRTGMVFFFS